MTTLLDATFERTLDAWIARYSAPEFRGFVLEGWLFESAAARRHAETVLAAAGVTARLRSAYKPLVHYFLEEADRAGLSRVRIAYPVPASAQHKRFTLEAYPLVAMLDGVDVVFAPGGEETHYGVELFYADGREQRVQVFAPNVLAVDLLGLHALSPSGWLRLADGAGKVVNDAAVSTEYQAVFASVIGCVSRHAWGHDEPFFERLEIRVDIPGMEFSLGVDEEVASTYEAMHEDIYFSLLEFFQRHSGRPMGDRGLQPGQIIPDVRAVAGAARAHISLAAFEPAPLLKAAPLARALALTDKPLPAEQVLGALQALGGTPFEARSRQGRAVAGTYVAGAGPAVFISAAQHANETSGVVGALRAAQALLAAGEAHFALIATENPDGYALHARLCEQHPRHMHHAARYSALGDDIAFREHEPLYEQHGRRQALALSGAQLHINLHGYPAHEWTRPLSGYLPRTFELWTVPKGFFLVLRHHTGWEAQARHLIEGVTARLARVPGLVDFNARQVALFRAHALEPGFEMMNGIPVQLSHSDRELQPLSLITEFPDETVYGERFVFAHTVQMETVLAATEVFLATPAPTLLA
jgi:hypothetical protein